MTRKKYEKYIIPIFVWALQVIVCVCLVNGGYYHFGVIRNEFFFLWSRCFCIIRFSAAVHGGDMQLAYSNRLRSQIHHLSAANFC